MIYTCIVASSRKQDGLKKLPIDKLRIFIIGIFSLLVNNKYEFLRKEVIFLKIYLLRMRAGLTQREVANRLGVNPSTVTHWEKGRNFPTVSCLPKLAELYGCTVDELLECKKEKEGL